MGFTKLDERILQSSIMAEPPETFKVWIALLASCGPDGIARVSSVFLSSVCRLHLEAVDKAIEILEGPDQRSRSLEDEGRRILRVDGGYFVVNYEKYRAFTYSRSEEAVRKRKWRMAGQAGTPGDISGHSGTPGDISGRSASASASDPSLSLPKSIKKEQKKERDATTRNPGSRPPAPSYEGGEWKGITDEDRAGWGKAYPACDLNIEFAKMTEWLKGHPAQAKKSNLGWRRFIAGWLSRTQDRGGSQKSGAGTFPFRAKPDQATYSKIWLAQEEEKEAAEKAKKEAAAKIAEKEGRPF